MTARTAPGTAARRDTAGGPATMTAMVQRRYGGPDALAISGVAVRDLGESDVLVRVRAAGVSVADDIIRGVPYFLRLMSGVRRPRHGRDRHQADKPSLTGAVRTGPDPRPLGPGWCSSIRL